MKLVKTFSLYTFVGFLNAGISFLLLPVLTNYLNPADYGIISLVNVYVSVFMPIVGLSTSGYIAVEYYNKDISKEEFRQLFSSSRVIPLIGILLLCIIFILGSSFLPGLMELPTAAYWLLLPLTFFSIFYNNFSTFLVSTKRASLFSIITIIKIFFEIMLTLLFVVVFSFHWNGRIQSALIAVGVFTFVSVFFYRKWGLLSLDVKKKFMVRAVHFGMPLILHQIGKFVINQSDRLFLTKMISLEEMGVYSVGYTIGSAIMLLVGVFTNLFTPFLYEKLQSGKESDKQKIIQLSYIMLGITLLALLVLTAISPLLFRWLIDKRYAGGEKYVFWIGLGYFFWAVYIIFSGYIFYFKKTKVLGYLSVLNVILNFLFNFLFIKWFGAIGAAFATCLSFLIVAVIIGLIANRIYPMPWIDFFRKNK